MQIHQHKTKAQEVLTDMSVWKITAKNYHFASNILLNVPSPDIE